MDNTIMTTPFLRWSEAGDRIGNVGLTGIATGAHLHWSVWRNGESIDSLSMIRGSWRTGGNVVGRGDIEAQTVAVFESLKETLASASATFADLTKITVFATKLEYRTTIGQIRARYITESPPASTFVVVASLADPDFLVEIEGIAVIAHA